MVTGTSLLFLIQHGCPLYACLRVEILGALGVHEPLVAGRDDHEGRADLGDPRLEPEDEVHERNLGSFLGACADATGFKGVFLSGYLMPIAISILRSVNVLSMSGNVWQCPNVPAIISGIALFPQFR